MSQIHWRNLQDSERSGPGIAAALKLSRGFTGTQKFAVILGDNFYEDSFSEEFASFHASESKAMIFTKQVEDPHRFGVYHEGSIEEKPTNPKSNRAVTGLYLYTEEVYDLASTLLIPRFVPLGLYQRARHLLGDAGIVDVTVLIGWFTAVSMTLAAFDVPADAEGLDQ